jgi:hypothetical protein
MMISDTMPAPRMVAGIAAAAFAVLVWASAGQAADAVFPTGSRVGLVPPPGMKPSTNFVGFEDPENEAAILVAAFPAEAFSALDKSMVPDALKKQGIDSREPMKVAGTTGFLLTGKQAAGGTSYDKWMLVAPAGDVTALVTVRAPEENKKYTDQTVRATLATLAVRPSVPDSERLSLLPFKVGDLAGFHIDDVLPGRALMLVDVSANDTSGKTPPKGNDEPAGQPIDARFLIAALPGGPNEPSDDENFARVTFDQIGGIGDVRIQDAEPLRIEGQPGYETLAKAKDPRGTDVMVVQWLRFGTGGYMQMIGIANADLWPGMLMRLRTIRDSVNTE